MIPELVDTRLPIDVLELAKVFGCSDTPKVKLLGEVLPAEVVRLELADVLVEARVILELFAVLEVLIEPDSPVAEIVLRVEARILLVVLIVEVAMLVDVSVVVVLELPVVI